MTVATSDLKKPPLSGLRFSATPEQQMLLGCGVVSAVMSLLSVFTLGVLKLETAADGVVPTLSGCAALSVLAIVLAVRKRFGASFIALTASLILVIGVGIFHLGYGLKALGLPVWAWVVCAASLFYGERQGRLAAGIGVAIAWGIFGAMHAGWLPEGSAGRQGGALAAALGLSLLLLMVYLIIRAFQLRADDARQDLLEESRQLQISIRQQQEAQREAEAFFASLSHAIRTPLTGIEAGLKLVRDSRLSEAKRRAHLALLQRSAAELNTMVSNLLDFNASRRGALSADAVCFHLEQLVGDLETVFKAMARQKGLNWSCSLEQADSLLVCGDETRLWQILTNMLSNAVKFCESGNTVTFSAFCLSANAQTAVWCFSVSDDGPGIDPEVLNRIFEPFVQDTAHGANKTSGMGMGLAVARELTALMGGSIHATSKPGEGSRFWVVLPFEQGLGHAS